MTKIATRTTERVSQLMVNAFIEKHEREDADSDEVRSARQLDELFPGGRIPHHDARLRARPNPAEARTYGVESVAVTGCYFVARQVGFDKGGLRIDKAETIVGERRFGSRSD